MEPEAAVQHETPVWRERANFIIGAALDAPGKWEQLWARQVGPNRFELCCIPFMTYGLARLFAIDGADEPITHAIAEALRPYEDAGQLNFETGWS